MSILQIQRTTGGSIGLGQAVIFDEIIEESNEISYDTASGVITVLKNGTYVFDWWVSTQSTPAPNVSFKLFFSSGNEYTGNTPAKIGNTSGFAIIEVTNAPVMGILQNQNTPNVFLSSVPIKAEIRALSIVTETSDASECFAYRQLVNILEQIIIFYPDKRILLYTAIGSSFEGIILNLYTAAGADIPSILVVQSGTQPIYVNIKNIDSIVVQESEYNDAISYLPLPEPFVQNCNNDAVLGFYETFEPLINYSLYVNMYSIYDWLNGTLIKNEYGMIVLNESMNMYTTFVVTTKIESIDNIVAP